MATLRDTAYILHLADNALILGQRNAEWCGHGPVLEEDIAMANISLDLIGQARLLYQLAARRENTSTDPLTSNSSPAKGRGELCAATPRYTEDHYAYWRSESEFRNFTLCELPHSAAPHSGNGRLERDYAVTIVRNVFYSVYMALLWGVLSRDGDEALAAIAVKSAKETTYHLRHAGDWLMRMGDGTDESHARAQNAVTMLYSYTEEFWLISRELRPQWQASLQEYLLQATLHAPVQMTSKTPHQTMLARGSQGMHSEHMGYLLAEMQSTARAHPGAMW
jgi:ring-1,2-phenylacetyl-CoA epoxidase subunit PaaC